MQCLFCVFSPEAKGGGFMIWKFWCPVEGGGGGLPCAPHTKLHHRGTWVQPAPMPLVCHPIITVENERWPNGWRAISTITTEAVWPLGESLGPHLKIGTEFHRVRVQGGGGAEWLCHRVSTCRQNGSDAASCCRGSCPRGLLRHFLKGPGSRARTCRPAHCQ